MHFCYSKLMKSYRLSTVEIGSHHFTWLRGTSNLAMEESDTKKTAFRASSMGLFVSTYMPFGLSNAGSSFCHLIKQYYECQQFVTLLLCLNDICIFAPTINDMLDCIELVFNRLKQFNLQIKPKMQFLALVYCSWVMSGQTKASLQLQRKLKK